MEQDFRALRIHAAGESTQARLEHLKLEDLSAGEVVIRVAWSSINYKDALAVTGCGRIMRHLPCVAGIDLAGVVERSATPDYRPGDPVLVASGDNGESLDGGLAEYARVPAESVLPLPAGLDLREAMALGTAGFTAGLAVRRLLENHLDPSRGPIAVTGATGGVGSVAISILSRLGFSVTAITGKAARQADYLEALGATTILDRNQLTLGTRPLEKGQWGGAVDNLGGETLAWLTRTTRLQGSIAAIGLAQGPGLATSVMPFILRGVSLLGIYSGRMPRAWRLAVWDKLGGPWKPAALSDIAARTVTLEEVPQACDALIAGGQHGRTLVRIGKD